MNRREFLTAAASTATCVQLAGCGGSDPGIKTAAAAAPTWNDPITPDGFKRHRDVMHVGGTPGWTCANTWITTYVGPHVTNFEWNLVAIIANEAAKGENCAAYFQAQSRNTGNTWAAVSEVRDQTFGEKPIGTMVAHEFDVACVGTDAEGRVGVHVVLINIRDSHGMVPSWQAVGTDAIRISANQESAKWRVGINFDTTPDSFIATREEGLVREPLGRYVGKLPIKVGERTVYIPVYE